MIFSKFFEFFSEKNSFLGSKNWSIKQQKQLEKSINSADFQKKKNFFLVGNPDVVGPWEKKFTLEPGYWTWNLSKKSKLMIKWFGKPYREIFNIAYNKLNLIAGYEIKKSKIAMVGDTLHTDILGANSFGLKSILMTKHGLFKNINVGSIIKNTKISPDYIVESP